MNSSKSLLVLTLSFAFITISGCATHFTGQAHIDKRACINQYQSWGMNLAGMIAMGEYSDACVCKVPDGKTALLDSDDGFLLSATAPMTIQR